MARIEIEGLEELNKLLQKMTLTDEDKRRAIKASLVPVSAEVEKNVPVDTGKLKDSLKSAMRRENNEPVGTVILQGYYGRHQEYGTSYQRKNVGFFARSIRTAKPEAMRVLKVEILSRLK